MQAERIPEVEAAALRILHGAPCVWLVGVGQLISAVFETAQWGLVGVGVHPRSQEGGPVVWYGCVQAGDDVFESVGNYFGSCISTEPVEGCHEVVESLFAVGHLADGGVDVQPDQLAFVVVIHAEPPVVPSAARFVEYLRCRGGVLNITPGTAGTVVVGRSDGRKPLLVLLGRPDAATGREHVSQIFSQALIYPEEIALHRFLIVAGREAGRTTVLAVPTVGELVRQ